MALEFFQYQVDRRWYRAYWAMMLVCSLLFTALHVVTIVVPSLADYQAMFGLTTASAVIAGISLTYLLISFPMLARTSLPFATLIGAMLYALMLLSGLTNADSQVGTAVYVLAWLPSVFFAGMYGLPLLASSLFTTFLYVALQNHFHFNSISRSEVVLLVDSLALAVASYFFWRTRFSSLQMQKVNQLSGMLQSNRQQSEVLIQSISDGILMVDTGGKITLINPAAAAMTEWPIGDAMGMDVHVVMKLHQEDGADVDSDQDPLSTVFTERKPINRTLQLEGQNGKKITISLSVSPVWLESEAAPRGAVAVLRDISEARAAEQQRGEFISTASHEMRTPVAAIEGYLALALNDKVSTIDQRARGFLDKAHASTQHLGKLFQDLLTSSKAEDGRLSNHPQVVEMGAFMQQLTDDLKFAAEKKGLLAEFVIGGADETIDATTKDASSQHLVKPLYYVNVDPERMREVLTNLFDNAVKYTDNGKVTLGLTGSTEVVQLYIRDTGAGIPAEDIPHLFQKFYRVDSSATRTIGGTGLGLFICRKIVELYRGRIWVESQVGSGSTFFINLPRLTTQQAADLQNAAGTLGSNAGSPGLTPKNT